MSSPRAAAFTGTVDLAAETLGGEALSCSDDFFAGMQNMLKPGAAVFIPGKYTERGKWMDGWESRRKRHPGFDYCIVRLGCPGQVVGFDIDTSHFLGNHPPYASVDGVLGAQGLTSQAISALPAEAWVPLLHQVPLLPGAQNLFAAVSQQAVSHVRLNIFPDGGVARFRVYGKVEPDWQRCAQDAETRAHLPEAAGATEWVDLAALTSGGVPLTCSDAFYGPIHNLVLPGRAADMGGGWETRRRRSPGEDWVLLQLGTRGCPRMLEIDTAHFKGNFPDRCAVEGLDAANLTITELLASDAWQILLPEQRLQADTRHFFSAGLERAEPLTHLRLRVIPDGGVSRFRVWGLSDV